MKFRSDFVTNSSSSSFIAVCNKDYEKDLIDCKKKFSDVDTISILSDGDYTFGWEFRKYNDFESKLNFVLIQVARTNDLELSKMVDSVLEEDLGVTVDWIDVYKQISDFDAYIDHQSLIDDDYTIKDVIFDSDESLRRFLYNNNSCVITGNDNTYEYEGRNGGLDLPYRNNSNYTTN